MRYGHISTRTAKIFILLILTFLLTRQHILAQEKPMAPAAPTVLDQGIAEYNNENYEEALIALEKAYKEKPGDAKTLLYLGLTHKELDNHREAISYFEETVAADPKSADGWFQLADTLYLTGSYEKALVSIDTALKENDHQPRLHLLKGQIYLKLEKNAEAVAALNKAKEQDPALTQQADYYIAVIAVRNGETGKAEELFNRIIATDTASEWAVLSREYLNAAKKTFSPFRFSARLGLQYDDNVLATPPYQTGGATTSKEHDWKWLFSLSGEYTFRPDDRWNIKAAYMLNAGIYSEDHYPAQNAGQKVISPSTISHTVSLTPMYIREKSVTSFLTSYEYLEVAYEKYMQTLTFSPSYTAELMEHHLWQVFARYKREEQNSDFYQKKLDSWLRSVDDKDADNYSGGAGYFYTFNKDKGIFSLKTEIDINNAEGRNWDYTGYKMSLGLLYPLPYEKLRVNLYGEACTREFAHAYVEVPPLFLPPPPPTKKRKDDIRIGQISLAYAVTDNIDATAGYAHIRNESNTEGFDYWKSLYTITLDYRF